MPSLPFLYRLARTLDPRRSLRARIALSFAALTLVLVVAGSAMEARRERQQLETAAGRGLADYADTMADQLGRDVDLGLTELRVMAQVPVARAANGSRESTRTSMFTHLSETRPAFAWIALADADGRIVAASGGQRIGEDVAREPWFAGGRKGPYVGGEAHPAPALERQGGGSGAPLRFVDLAVPAAGDDGRDGVLGMYLSLAWARAVRQRLLAAPERPPGTELIVLDRAGNVVLGSQDSEGKRLDLPWLPTLRAGEDTFATGAWPDGRTYLVGAALERNLGWRVLARQDPDAALAPVTASHLRTILQAAVLALACGLLGWWLAGRIAAPLRAITRAARRIRQGEPAEIPLAPHDDEIAELSRTLRETMHGLAGQRAELAAQLAERERVQRQLMESEERLARALEGATLALWDADIANGTIYLSEHWARMLGERPAPAVTNVEEIYERVHPDDRARMRQAARDVIKGVTPAYDEEYRIRGATGQWVWVQSRGKVVERDERGRAVRMTGTNADVTQRRQAEQRIQYLATRDALTDLPNATLLADRIEQALTAAQRDKTWVALLYIDLDRFKYTNDSLGQRVGDALLRAVAARLKVVLRKEDSLARKGSDEFVALLPSLSGQREAASIAYKVLAAVARPFDVEGHTLHISASIGIALYPSDGRDAATLMKSADTAMDHAKEAGGNKAQFFAARMRELAQHRHLIETHLRTALQRNEFTLNYQPLFDLTTEEAVGVEALLRWNNPALGAVPPRDFIPVAEDSGLIVPIGQWVLAEACRQVRNWQDAGHRELRVAVNVSVRQFRRKGFSDSVQSALALSGLAPRHLEIEITESVLMEQSQKSIAELETLSGLGVRLCIDDFGTGYSGLSYLKRLPVHRLKIDQSFVRDIARDPNDAAIVSAVIALSRSLGLKVTAEGVESEAQLRFLLAHACNEAQGYYFSVPVPAEEVVQALVPRYSQRMLRQA